MRSSDIANQHGDGGYWCQGDAVFIKSNNPVDAVNSYRQKLSQGGIGITSNLDTLDAYKAKLLSETFVQRRHDLKECLNNPTTREFALGQIAEWVVSTAIFFGSSTVTAHKVAAAFIEGIEQSYK